MGRGSLRCQAWWLSYKMGTIIEPQSCWRRVTGGERADKLENFPLTQKWEL